MDSTERHIGGRSEIGTDKLPVSVVIPAKNEESNLPKCLTALGDRFAEVVVVDSGSTDRTVAIAQAHGAKVLQFRWDGMFPKKRNWTLLNYKFKAQWVLFLDADEVVSNDFISELAQKTAKSDMQGFWLNYSNMFLGRELRHGVPQKKLALLKVGAGLYEKIEEENWSKLDMEVHEHPIIDGAVGEIAASIRHEDYRGIKRFIDRHCDYAAWEARRFALLQHSKDNGNLTPRQSFKYKHINSWWYSFFYFFYAFFVKCGFMDGFAGFSYAFYKMWYFFTIRIYILEFQQDANTNGVGGP